MTGAGAGAGAAVAAGVGAAGAGGGGVGRPTRRQVLGPERPRAGRPPPAHASRAIGIAGSDAGSFTVTRTARDEPRPMPSTGKRPITARRPDALARRTADERPARAPPAFLTSKAPVS